MLVAASTSQQGPSVVQSPQAIVGLVAGKYFLLLFYFEMLKK